MQRTEVYVCLQDAIFIQNTYSVLDERVDLNVFSPACLSTDMRDFVGMTGHLHGKKLLQLEIRLCPRLG